MIDNYLDNIVVLNDNIFYNLKKWPNFNFLYKQRILIFCIVNLQLTI